MLFRSRYRLVEWNLQAIHHVLEAERTKLRHGGLDLVRTSFRGFAALPAPPGKKAWHDVLGVKPDAAPAQISEARKRLARVHHDDAAMMQAINVAHDDGMAAGGKS
jgi:DnaJ-domain-containing protein 1